MKIASAAFVFSAIGFAQLPEGVQELKWQTTPYDIVVSPTGAVESETMLSSSSNELHGSAVRRARETDWSANNFFANKAGQSVPNEPFYNWILSLGGPIRIPQVYDGRNKTFFFASEESYRKTDGSTTVLSVPTALELSGDFSQSYNKNGGRQIIYNPLSFLANRTRLPFPNNVIPRSLINPVGRAIANYYPSPNQPTPYYAAPNYSFTGTYQNRSDLGRFLLDHEFASWFRLSAYYHYQKTSGTDYPVNIFPNSGTPDQTFCCDRKIDATGANLTLMPDARTVITIRWGFNRVNSQSTLVSQGFDLASLGLPPSLVSGTQSPAFPAIGMNTTATSCSSGTSADFSNFGGGCASQDTFSSRSFNATVSKFLRRHAVKAGFDFRTMRDAGTPATGPTSLAFSDVFTRANAAFSATGTGSSLATLLLGYPTSGGQSIVTPFNEFLRHYGGFIQDDYRATPKLTLNFGLRFDYDSGLQERNNQLITGFNGAVANPLQQDVPGLLVPGEVLYAGANGAPAQTGSVLSVKPAVRVGFAYAIDSRTVVRGGYGLFWVPAFFNHQNAVGYSQNTSVIASTNNSLTPAATISNPYPNGLLQPTRNTLGGLSGIGQPIAVYSPGAKSAGYIQESSLEVQREVPQGFVLSLGALSSHGVHLLENDQNIDQLNPALFPLAQAMVKATPSVSNPFYGNGGIGTIGTAKISPVQLLLPFPQYTSVALFNADTGGSRRYAFYVRAQRRFSAGLSLLAFYTWSRSEDDVTAVGPQNAYNPAGEWSPSKQDTPNRFTTAITYALPFGKGKPFLTNNEVLNWIVRGWSASAVGTIQNGYPLSLTQSDNNSVFGASYQRPNATGVAPATSGSTDDRLNGWLNPAAFSQATAYTFGNVSRFLNVRGPGLFNWDVSLTKSFVIGERVKAKFRAEALNVTNTVYFGNPATGINSPTFGQITSQINSPRLIQLGLWVSF